MNIYVVEWTDSKTRWYFTSKAKAEAFREEFLKNSYKIDLGGIPRDPYWDKQTLKYDLTLKIATANPKFPFSFFYPGRRK